jgi:hypothetical protein
MPTINVSNERLNDNDFLIYASNMGWINGKKFKEKLKEKKLIVEREAHLDVDTLYSFLLTGSCNLSFKF